MSEKPQAVRDAAADWLESAGLDRFELATDIRAGKADDYPTVRAFNGIYLAALTTAATIARDRAAMHRAKDPAFRPALDAAEEAEEIARLIEGAKS